MQQKDPPMNRRDTARQSRNQTAGLPDSTQRPQRVSKGVAEETCSLRTSAPTFAVRSTHCVAIGEDFFNAEDAKVGAEFRRENVSAATLFETLCGLGVESGGPAVWLRLGRAMSPRFIGWSFA